MTAVAGAGWAWIAYAAWYAADAERRARTPGRAAAALALAASGACFARAEGVGAGALLALWAATFAASVVPYVSVRWPRAARALGALAGLSAIGGALGA